MHKKFWSNEYRVGSNEAVLTLNDIQRVEFNLENGKCYFIIGSAVDEKLEVTYEDAMRAIASNKRWRPV